MAISNNGRIRVEVTGAKGKSFADTARAAGSFGVMPNDSDAIVNQKFADYAIQENPGFKGGTGDTGPANSTYLTLAGLKAAEVTNASYIFAPPLGSDGGLFAGTFLYQTAGAPYTADGVDTIALDAVPLSTGALVRQGASSIATPDGNLQQVLDARKPVTVLLTRLTGETNDDAAWLRALAAVTAAGGGTIQVPARQIVTTVTWFVPSNVVVEGVGDASHLIFSGADPAAITGSPTSPRWGNLRTAAIAIAGTNPDDMVSGVYNDGQTGDYATTDLRAFAANTTLMPGATQMTVADATGLAAGGFVWLEAGWIGWHTALHEIAQIKSVSGNTVTFTAPIQYRYSNVSTDAFSDFMDRFAYGGSGPPGVTGFPSWRQAGYRRIAPVQNARVRNLKITNTIVRGGYANLAVAIQRGLNCSAENVTVGGGGVWNIKLASNSIDNFHQKRCNRSLS